MKTEKRVYRTLDGTLVREGDPKAAFLAYGAGDDVENRDVDTVTALFDEPVKRKPGRPKKIDAPENKMASRPDDK